MNRTAIAALLACGLAVAVQATPLVPGPVPEGSIGHQVLLVAAPGVPIAGTFSAQAVETGALASASPWRDSRPDRTESVTIPGLVPRNQFADTVHWLLGVATLASGVATGLTAGEADDDGGGSLHHTLGYTTAGIAAATLLTGLWAHWGDVGVADGASPQNIHALLGITGGLLMVATPFVADMGGGEEGGGHAALGVTGGLLMGISVIWPLVF
jgi:hypothetical protein